uniref:Uncharacterized protein n=1 Tax=Myotis myotis TaxID=51298 RepID=A0A7J7VYZ9_MYOMY|nr:hypothetical protein mMyoMyo1_012274 [Myotis myotis]
MAAPKLGLGTRPRALGKQRTGVPRTGAFQAVDPPCPNHPSPGETRHLVALWGLQRGGSLWDGASPHSSLVSGGSWAAAFVKPVLKHGGVGVGAEALPPPGGPAGEGWEGGGWSRARHSGWPPGDMLRRQVCARRPPPLSLQEGMAWAFGDFVSQPQSSQGASLSPWGWSWRG